MCETKNSLYREMLTSLERVQMTTLASACQSNLESPNDEAWITERCLRLLPDSWVMIAKVGWLTKARLLLLRIDGSLLVGLLWRLDLELQ